LFSSQSLPTLQAAFSKPEVPQIVALLGGKAMRQFSVGDVVTWIPDILLRSETHGDYRVVAAMPDRDGERVYRIKSPLEEYERVVKEDLLVRSSATLPEEVHAVAPRRPSITLATLSPQGLGVTVKVARRH
jgi:hypothetical protein